MPKFRIGRHIGIRHGFTTAPEYASDIGCQVFQVFLGAPTQITSKPKTEDQLTVFAAELKRHKLKMVIHAAYTINLCHPKKAKIFQSSVKSLVQDLNAASIIGKRCLGVIIHMGKNIPANKISDEKAIKNYVIGLQQALAESPEETTIILETGASQGSEVGSDIDGLTAIYSGLEDDEKERVKFCIDTCHIWATGYDISTSDGVKDFFTEFDEKIGLDKIACIHFNDSKTALGSGVDRHADLAYGFIKETGLKAVVQFAQKHHIPVIMETPLEAVNIKTNQEVTFEEEFGKAKSWLKSKK
jgi:deoxyribonuclease IV